MKTKPIQRTLSLISALAMLLTVLAVPAFAATAPTSTAKLVGTKDFLAGTQAVPFTIEVDYPSTNVITNLQNGGGKGDVQVVQVIPPLGLITDLVGTTEGWTAAPDASGHLYFIADEGKELKPGTKMPFTFVADVAAPSQDLAREFKVFLSSDKGATYTQSTAAPGDLVASVRVLAIKSVELIAPGGVTDYTASTDQSNVVSQITVENRGAPAGTGRTGIDVQPSLTGATTNTTPASKVIPYGTTATFDFGITMPSDPGTVTLTGDAAGKDVPADAISEESAPITVLRRVTLAYKAGSVDPRSVIGSSIPTAPAYAFSVGLTNAGQVGATLDALGTNFTMAEFTAALATANPAAIASDTTELALTFERKLVPLNDGEYMPSVRVIGADENDAPIDSTISISDKIKVDTDVPIVNAVLNGAASHLDNPDASEAQVTTNGGTVTVSGTVKNTDGTTCNDCSVTSAVLQQLSASLGAVGQPIPVTVTANGGTLSGSATPTYDAATRFVRLTVSVQDGAGLGSSASSGNLLVDNVAPTLALAKTGPAPATVTADRPAARRTITVFESESVKFSPNTSPTDWKVDGATVLGARAYRDTGAPTPGHADFVVLSLSSDLAADQTPRVTYELPSGLDGNRGHDQVKKPLANQFLTAVDGIVPDLAQLFKVNDRQRQDDAFFTNTTSPTITFNNISLGHTVEVFEQNADGTKTLIDRATQQNDSGVMTLNKNNTYAFSVTSPGGDREILVEVLDAAGNRSGIADFTITFDFVAPTLNSIVQDGRTVTVTLSESLSKDPNYQGRNVASDWTAVQGSGQFAEGFTATSVASGGPTVTLTMEQKAASAQLDTVTYRFKTALPDGRRYEDRAGNPLADFTGTVTR